MHDSWAYKTPKNFRNRSRSSALPGDYLPKVEIYDVCELHSHHPAPIEVKLYTSKPTQVPVGCAKFDVNRCNESPLRGEKPFFGL